MIYNHYSSLPFVLFAFGRLSNTSFLTFRLDDHPQIKNIENTHPSSCIYTHIHTHTQTHPIIIRMSIPMPIPTHTSNHHTVWLMWLLLLFFSRSAWMSPIHPVTFITIKPWWRCWQIDPNIVCVRLILPKFVACVATAYALCYARSYAAL